MAIVKKIKLEEFNQTIEKICTLSDNRFSRIITSGYIDTVTQNDVDKTYMVFVYNYNSIMIVVTIRIMMSFYCISS